MDCFFASSQVTLDSFKKSIDSQKFGQNKYSPRKMVTTIKSTTNILIKTTVKYAVTLISI